MALRIKRLSAVLAVLVLALTSISFAAGSQASWLGQDPTVVTDKDVYLMGESVRIKVTCYIPMAFSSGKQCYFVVEDSMDNVVYNMSKHYFWIMMLTTLSPPKTFAFNWDQENDTGVQVPAGSYEIWGYEAGYRMSDPPIAGNSTQIKVVEDGPLVQAVQKSNQNLAQGWNLISLPLLASNYTSSSIGLPIGSVIAGWNSATSSYDTFIVGLSPSSMDFALVDFRAYFVYVAAACTITIFGSQVASPQTFQWILPPSGFGWVPAGFPYSGATHYVSEIPNWIDTPGVRVILVARYDSMRGVYQTWLSDVPAINNFMLMPGQGYYICLSSPVSVVSVTYP